MELHKANSQVSQLVSNMEQTEKRISVRKQVLCDDINILILSAKQVSLLNLLETVENRIILLYTS